MILNEMTKQNVKIPVLPTAALKEGLGSIKTENSFKDVFGGVAAKDTGKNPGVTCRSTGASDVKHGSSRNEGTENDTRSQLRSFRELQRTIRNNVRRNIIQNGKSVSDSCEDNSKQEVDEGAEVDRDAFNEAMINCFASLTGLKPDEFKAVLDEAGVTGDELASLTDIEGIAGKIAGAAGLDSEQKAMLIKLMNMAADKISSMAGMPDDGNGISAADSAADQKYRLQAKAKDDSDSINISVKSMMKSDEISAQAMFRDILSKLKMQLNELRSRLENGSFDAAEEIDAKLDELLNSLKPAAADKAADADTQGTNDLKEQTAEGYKNQAVQNARESKSEEGKAAAAEVKPAVEAVTAADTSTTAVNPLNYVQNQNNEVQGVKERLDIKAPVQAKEIIHQVIEKAKVVITPDKSEMLMDLKPESLGKLTLKVVTEQGIVMAKFIAENEQVKQILESNMQLLKDSLEKQGMNVQSFSVSVKQDNSYSSRGQNDSREQKQTSAVRGISGIGGTGIAAAVDAAESLTKSNPYSWGSSTINLTA